ncbi:MAG: WYL domain-containing protein [Treponema sp.]|nr:WYL domain-containing protein [Treponema sp.]
MGYSELIKSLDTIRMYVRSFYVYGFKGRKDFAGKSGRTYDDERRRLENYLSPYMSFRTDEGGKVSFVSIDSRRTSRNPLYKIFKAKSFTAMDISLHFMLMDILHGPDVEKSLVGILDEINSVYLDGFSADLLPEESTLRKKLSEYCALGLLCARKEGKTMLYRRSISPDLSARDGGSGIADMLSFFSETAPCGVIGSFMLDKLSVAEQTESDLFEFKHHYISPSIESDLLCTIFTAIRERRSLTLVQQKSGREHPFSIEVVPLVVYQSTQGGRLYLMAYKRRSRCFMPLRVDYIQSIKTGEVYAGWEQKRAEFEKVRKHIWGVALKTDKKHNDVQTTHVSFTVRFGDGEEFIYERLLREKRIGEVTRLDRNTARFDADIYDPQEIFPWVRTFISRITDFSSSDGYVTRRFYDDIRTMSRMYGKETQQ